MKEILGIEKQRKKDFKIENKTKTNNKRKNI